MTEELKEIKLSQAGMKALFLMVMDVEFENADDIYLANEFLDATFDTVVKYELNHKALRNSYLEKNEAGQDVIPLEKQDEFDKKIKALHKKEVSAEFTIDLFDFVANIVDEYPVNQNPIKGFEKIRHYTEVAKAFDI